VQHAIENCSAGKPEFELPAFDLGMLAEKIVEPLLSDHIARHQDIPTDDSNDRSLVRRRQRHGRDKDIAGRLKVPNMRPASSACPRALFRTTQKRI